MAIVERETKVETGYYHTGERRVYLNHYAKLFLIKAWEHFEDGLVEETLYDEPFRKVDCALPGFDKIK